MQILFRAIWLSSAAPSLSSFQPPRDPPLSREGLLLCIRGGRHKTKLHGRKAQTDESERERKENNKQTHPSQPPRASPCPFYSPPCSVLLQRLSLRFSVSYTFSSRERALERARLCHRDATWRRVNARRDRNVTANYKRATFTSIV